MKATEVIGDPLYQANLILWMLRPSKGTFAQPILARAGFVLRDIEPELHLPIPLKTRLAEDNVDVSDPVTPEVIMKSAAGEYVLVECKRSMFGNIPPGEQTSSQVKQARSLLLQVPSILASALGEQRGTIKGTCVTYLARRESRVSQTQGVKDICTDLNGRGYETAPFGLFALVVEGKSVVMHLSEGGWFADRIKKVASGRSVTIHEMDESETDPRPLYIVPWMPGNDRDDDYAQTEFGNRVLLSVVARVGPSKPPYMEVLEFDALLDAATQGHYQRWRKKAVRKALKDNVKDLIKNVLGKYAPEATLTLFGNPSNAWQVNIPDEQVKDKIIEGLRKWTAEKWATRPQRTLFESADDNGMDR